MDQNQPSWMSENPATTYPTAPPAGYRPPSAFSSTAIGSENKGWVKLAVKVVVIGMSAMMCANGENYIEYLQNSI